MSNTEKIKVAIIGSREYTNKAKIQEFIFNLKGKFNSELIIVSGGAKYGADKYGKRFALDFDLEYHEFPPFHESHNMYCVLDKFYYNKPYNVGNYHGRNKKIAEYSDYIVAFVPNEITNGTASAIKYSSELGKKFVIIRG
jgi:predicted Rossmann fold nucleotide-binding protein DprA/Smf involved in DNA uptake